MIAGKTMIQRVYEQASRAALVAKVVVATDDPRILEHVREFGGTAMLTSAYPPSGTDRCAEVAAMFPEADIILNIQGDEPFVQPEQINLLAQTLLERPRFQIATLAKRIEHAETLLNPNAVKVVFSQKNGAIYFSRHPIPFVRDAIPESWLERHIFYKHIGLYAFRRTTLQRIARLRPTPLELAESLEQLRWLEHGLRIAVGITELETIGVDTPADLERLQNQPVTV